MGGGGRGLVLVLVLLHGWRGEGHVSCVCSHSLSKTLENCPRSVVLR